MKAHDFPSVYKTLGIDLSQLGCVMLDLEPLDNAWSMEYDGAAVALYYARDKARFWIDGWVFDRPHVTLLYGLLTPANENPMRVLVPQVLKDWKLPDVEIEHVGYFDSPYPDEPYWCIVAHLKITPELMEGHERLCMLPHIKTFPGYKAHVTIAYINKDQGEQYRDGLIDSFNKLWAGRSMRSKALNLGGNKNTGPAIKPGSVWRRNGTEERVCVVSVNEMQKIAWVSGVVDEVDPRFPFHYLLKNYSPEEGWAV